MKFYKINSNSNFDQICSFIKPTKIGQNIISKKSSLNFILIKDIKFVAINILKQDALSIGADLLCPKDAIFGGDCHCDALLIANDSQIQKLIEKEKLQDFGLKNLAIFLENKFLKPKIPQIMGVVNINEDSFNPLSRVDCKNGIKKIEKFIEDGADFIDVGGVSSRPGSVYCGEDEEFGRIKDLILEIYRLNLYKKVKFSLDSFNEKCLKFALDNGFKMINDISGDINLTKLAKNYDASYVLMHMQNNPQNMQENPQYDDLLGEIDNFFSQKLELCQSDKIYLDPGIGFGKTAKQNLILTKHLEHFLHFNKPILYGASRKSVINFYSKSKVEDRISGSLYLHLKAFENGATIIRTHDVFEHKQMFNLHLAMEKVDDEL